MSQRITFRAALAAVPWQQDGIVTVQVRTVLLYILAVDLPRLLSPTMFLLPEKHRKQQSAVSLSRKLSPAAERM